MTQDKKTAALLINMYDRMYRQIGPRGWWPGRTRFEICTGAILTQNTAWHNVKMAIDNLRAGRLLSAQAIRDIDPARLAELIKPSGYYNQKAKKLKTFADFLYSGHGGSLDRLFRLDAPELRAELLSVNGIGRETADSIILYAAKKPIFVIDAYTRRILSRHNIAGAEDDYDDLRALFENNLPADTRLFNEFHALIVYTGHTYCKKNPLCDACPLSTIR